MHTGTKPVGSQHFFNSFFSGNAIGRSWEPVATPLRSSAIQITPEREEENRQGYANDTFDPEQRASAAILAQDENGDCDDDAFGSTHIPQSMSVSSFSQDQVSVSPAAMFLSAFSSPVTTSAPLPDAEGYVVSGYTFGSIIGYGAFSTIRRALSNSGGVAAVKIVRRSDISKRDNATLAHKRIRHEAAVWSTLSHEHILPLFSAVHTSYADYFFTLFCPAGSLFDILKRDGRPALPQDDVGMMFRQVVRGLRYLHEVALFVHRDIKLENVLVDEMGVCRIGDFGMTRKIGELDEDEEEPLQELQENMQTGNGIIHRATSLMVPSSRKQPRQSLQIQLARQQGARHRNSTPSNHSTQSTHVFQPGSLPYASPELLLPQISGPLLPHPAQDIWALGVLLYGLLMGRLPFVDSFEPRLQMKILNGAYQDPPDIGRGAERVLKGCLDRSVASRWTIAMVDEVAWGIGWGTEGDDVTPAESDEEFDTHPPVKTPSRSRSRHPDVSLPETPQWQHEERRSRPSIEAASRRSSSRIKRSISRAPVMASRSSSGRNILGRSMSRNSRAPSPSFSALNSSIFGSTITTSPPTSPFNESALLVSPPLSLERGRRLRKFYDRSPSRSPSPSIAPTTPIDSRIPLVLETQSNILERESSRGRKKYSQGLRSDHLYTTMGDTTSELDVLDETADWAAASADRVRRASSVAAAGSTLPEPVKDYYTEAYIGWHRNDRSASKPAVVRAEAYFDKKRPGSSPPAPASLRALANGNNHRTLGLPKKILNNELFNIPNPISTLDGMIRSRSLESECRGNGTRPLLRHGD